MNLYPFKLLDTLRGGGWGLNYSLDFFLGGGRRLPSVREFFAYIHSVEGRDVVYNNRVVGKIFMHPVMGKIYVTLRDYDSHVLKKWGTIGVSRDVIKRLILERVSYVVVAFRDAEKVVYTTPQKFMDLGKSYWNKKEGDMQLHLPLSCFKSL